MTSENNVGLYIGGSGRGIGGPLMEDSLSAYLVYGKLAIDELSPPHPVRPVEKAFELLRYFNPDNQGHIYVVRFDPENTELGNNKNAVAVAANPDLNRVFDHYIPEYERESERYYGRWEGGRGKGRTHIPGEAGKAFTAGMEKAGLTQEDAKKLSDEDAGKGTNRHYTEFYLEVVKHIEELPKLPFIKVEGIDDILDSIDIMPLPER